MEAAFDRLTTIQRINVNRHMFFVAYNCVVRSGGNKDLLARMISEETADCPHLEADLMRYCKMVQRVM